ncbi:MAG: PLDc_N domain-containing protein [Candidatus Omnitrophica bacterium]|nr:PLDc_N domain-containing protein [Candidatus Omnitrophota bacterium]
MQGLIGLIILILDIIALVDLWKGKKDTGKKVLWTLLILIAPLVGLIIYYMLGRKA